MAFQTKVKLKLVSVIKQTRYRLYYSIDYRGREAPDRVVFPVPMSKEKSGLGSETRSETLDSMSSWFNFVCNLCCVLIVFCLYPSLL